ncbi:SDR family oxidoreductase [Candidatus Pelagibacter sp.]|nr:SDR family oxidoreductase [Candidatus Pelagibacter sp.]
MVVKIIDFIIVKFLSIDVLINCVARDYIPNKNNNKLFENLSIKDLNSDFEIGITTSVIMAKHVSKFMIKQNKGNILNIGSDLSFISPNQNIYSNFVKPISYSIVKHGIIGLTKYLATYLTKYNIRCNALCPGGMYNNQDKKFLTKLNQLIPMKRMAKKNELNEAMYFLISEKSSYVNGHSLMVDGGRTIW